MLTKEEYNRVAHRGMAIGALAGVPETLEFLEEHLNGAGYDFNDYLLRIAVDFELIFAQLMVLSLHDHESLVEPEDTFGT